MTLYDATSPRWNIWRNNLKDFNLDNYSNSSLIVCFLEVDLDYPDELHDLHNYYPLAVGKVKVFKKMLSDYHYKS